MKRFAFYNLVSTAVAIFTTIFFPVSGHEITGSNEVSYERLLYKYIMEDYNPAVRPVRNDQDSLQLNVNLHVYLFEDLDEVNQALQASGWLFLQWNDFQLSWNPEDYGNVNRTRVPISKLWSPDVTVINSLDTNLLAPGMLQLAVVVSTGDVTWVPAMNFRTYCPLDLTHFPFDEHLCSIHIMAWTYDEVEVNMTTNYNDLQSVSEGSSEWELVSTDSKRTSTKYSCCPNPFVDIKFQLLLRRRPTFASHLFIAPSIILCLITPTIFILPPASFEKLTLGTGILIGHVLLLGELINFVPSAHPTIPLMGKFFLANIVMVSLSLAISVVVLNLWSRSKTRCVGPPSFCRTMLLNWVLRRVLLIDFDDYDDSERGPSSSSAGEQSGTLEVMTDITVTDSVNSGTAATDDRARVIDEAFRGAAKTDWRRMAVVIDRLFFVIFAVIMIATCLAFTGYL